ncbi:MAG: hypothetical protein M1822_004324 [Bathelium mastoideum]|nr:MAG: hypothetical protein M1822_004324 [Bathelium mastoideum]
MATEEVQSNSSTTFVPQSNAHPFAPLSAEEIKHARELLRSVWPANTEFYFKAITLEEPPKAEVLSFLESEHAGIQPKPISRRAFVAYYLRRTNKFHEAIVNISSNVVEYNVRLGPNMHPWGDAEELMVAERAVLEDAEVKKEIAKLKLPEGTVVITDPWTYGSDGVEDDERMYQCFLYIRDPTNPSEEDSNHYALPLPISPVIRTDTMKVIRIDLLPTGADATLKETQPYKLRPANEYIPESQNLRTDVKPLNVVQPEGASFKVTQQGTLNLIEWQKWDFRVSFNQREGPVLHDVRYDGRSLFYRVSLSDMNIPYADPRRPFHKKAAFDLGDAGAGVMANNLKLGCDCLGAIHYLDGLVSTDKGDSMPMENVVCIHEQDGGIGWKHTNYRTGRAVVTRQRELVVQTIITVSNYEYIMAYMFNQAGEFTYEVRATGVLSTQPIDDDISVPFGTVVHPGVLAVHHQHIFSLRIDPILDGPQNRLVYDEAHAMPRSDFNPHGIGYTVNETLVEKSGGYDLDPDRNRTFKIQNTAVRNPVNGKPVAYKIHAPPFQKMLADKESFHHKRAEFADHNLYVTRYADGELFAGGKYSTQSRGGTGVRSWADRRDDIVDADLVLFVQFGINHLPRCEDFPVMPCEVLKVSLKPVNFFVKNPALDVPPSEQAFNRSVLVSEQHHQPTQEGTVTEQGDVCCSSKL